MRKKELYIIVIIYSIIALLCLLPHLGSLPVRQWDEARLGVSALEMHESHNPIVVTFNHQPDLWNTKPPLMIWLQSLLMYIFGQNVIALRIPSVLAAFILGLVFIWFGRKINYPYIGFFSALITYCSWNVLFWHCSRTGEYDAVLLLFTVLYVIHFWLYTEDTSKKRHLSYFFLFLTLAALTKDIQALIFTPVMLLYLIITKTLTITVKSKQLWIGLGFFILCLGSFFLLRESLSPGYMKAFWFNNVTGRYNEGLDQANEYIINYFEWFQKSSWSLFFSLLPFAFIFNLYHKNKSLKRLSIFSFCIGLFYFIIASCSKTRWEWYIYPVIPVFSITIAICFDTISQLVKKYTKKNYIIPVRILLALLVFGYPLYNNILGRNGSFHTYEKDGLVQYNASIQIYDDIVKNKIKLKDNTLYALKEEFRQDALFYQHILTKQNYNISFVPVDSITNNSNVLVSYNSNIERIDSLYSYKTLFMLHDSKLITVINKKQ